MEDFILGLLMVNRFTAYDLHVLIKNNYDGICSSSIGNIQRALKKLHEKAEVSLEVVTEGKVVKKVFSITPVGRKRFMTWLNNPIDLLKAKNMEAGRLLLLGFLTEEQQIANIDKTIADYRAANTYMDEVKKAVDAQTLALADSGSSRADMMSQFLINEPVYAQELMDSVEGDDFEQVISNVAKYSLITLEYAIAEMKFSLEWFENLRARLVEERGE